MSRSRFLPGAAGAVLAALLLAGPHACDESKPTGQPDAKARPDESPAPAARITLECKAFTAGQPVPRRHTGDGEDVAPALTWSGLPQAARELALIVDDPDAPSAQPWVHWVIYKIPAGAPGLPAPPAPAGCVQGKNSWGTIGWRGPSPPRGHGVHHYHFRLYALDAALDLKPGLDKEALLAAMKGHVLAEGELVGTYERK